MHVQIFYGVTFAISMLNLWLFLSIRVRQTNIYYPAMFILMVISNGGYWTLAQAQTVEGAIIANRLCYIAGCFLMAFTFLCLLDLCSVRIPFWVHLLLNGVSIAMYSIILFTGINNWYYTEQDIAIANGYTHLVRTTGPLYPLFFIHTGLYIIAIIIFILYAYAHKKTVSYKNMLYLLGMVIGTAFMYFLNRLLGYDFNLVPLAFALDGVILILLRRRIALYDVTSTIAESITKQNIYGYATFDKNKAFLASDHMARDFFPELAKLRVDHILPNDTDIYANLHLWMSELDETKQPIIHYETAGNREVKCTANYIYHENSIRHDVAGYMFEFFDVTDERKYLNLIAQYNQELRRDVAKETAHVKEVQNKLILGMANMIENRDNNTGGHIKRTSKCIEILVEELRNRHGDEVYSEQFCNALVKAAPMHDIGKIAVPDAILQKPGRFTPEEFEQMKEHAAKGAEVLGAIIENVEDEYFVTIAENMAHYHHERWNGTGYPNQLKEEEIPLEARIMAIADVYDALVSKRCYKEKMDFEEAANIIREGIGTQFDPSLGDVFEACRERLEAYYQTHN